MDIWKWVYQAQDELLEQGHKRLADLIDELPSAVVNDDIAKVDAIYPEALALARNQSNPWVELFIRHWNLQSRVLRRDEGQGQLQEATSLLDFASQESTKDCPQAICVVQDLASCYENVDSVGYAKERVAVASESLARINPQWPCYSCITSELLSAKKTLGQYEEALDDIQQARAGIMAADPDDPDTHFTLIEGEVLSELGRYDEAIKVVQSSRRIGGGEHFERSKKMTLSVIYAQAGDYDKALDLLLPFAEIKNALSLGHDWCDVCFILAMNDKIDNDWRLHHYFEQLCQEWLNLGCMRSCFNHSVQQAKLAVKRQQADSLSHCIARLEKVLPQLRVDAGAAEQLAELKAALQTIPPLELDDADPDSVLAALPEDPEQRLAVLNSALKQSPDAELLAVNKIETLQLLEQSSVAFAEQYLQDYPNSEQVLAQYGFDQPRLEFLTQLGEQALNEDMRLMLHWVTAAYYRRADDLPSALQAYQAILKMRPQAKNTLLESSRVAMQLKNYQLAVDYCRQLLSVEEDNDAVRWDMVVAATLAGQWSEVRQQARQLGMEVDAGDEPIQEQWSWVRIALKEEGGGNYRAIRTGPVTAQIYASSPIGEEKVYLNEVVFDPAPLNQLDQQDEEGNPVDAEGHNTHLFQMIDALGGERSQWQRFDLEGVYPGEERWQKLLDDLSALDITLFLRSGQEYSLTLEDKKLPAIYAYLMVPMEMEFERIHQHLMTLTEDLEHPMIWPLLAYLSEDESIRQRNQDITKKYDISSNDYEELDQTLLS